MYLLIAIIFIAELIIALTLISYIIKADNAVKKCRASLTNCHCYFEKTIKDIRFCVESFGDYYDCIMNSVKKKRRQFQINMVKNTVMYLSLFLLKGKYKKIAAFLQFAVLFHDYVSKIHTE